MSIGILISVHDGIVLASDSASTLTLMTTGASAKQDTKQDINVYNNANKISNLIKGQPIGCVAFGSGRPAGVETTQGYGQAAYWDPKTDEFNILVSNNWYILTRSSGLPATMASAPDVEALAKQLGIGSN